ncbi:hypothetical protein FH609_025955 [Streptomyces sp. 3MP-14]|uniref:Lipoprotein n=1 Tax=Streptomyces mimosae TaxID=2586635 RepID=A0A5N6A100_9ACTN|nr:hypothetical protein FH607_024995 [Streptomyces mimosae]KAB8173542.1 hypothetical protein FH609_025955 [Streptomyces sp. 3MP-14]
MSGGLSGGLAAALAVPLAGALVGCSADASVRPDGPSAVSVQGLRRRTARDSAELVARYEATERAHPGLAEPLAPFREVALAHLRALSDGEPSAPARRDVAVPEEPAEAVGALIEAERRTSEGRLAGLAEAPPELARLLASLAAAGAAQAQLLEEVRA